MNLTPERLLAYHNDETVKLIYTQRVAARARPP